MTGTPSRKHGWHQQVPVQRKLETKLRSEEHESHTEAVDPGREGVARRTQQSSGSGRVYMRRICGVKVTCLTPGDLMSCPSWAR